MDNVIRSALDKAKALWEKQQQKRRERQLAKESAVRLGELEARFHRVDNVVLPFPTLYALQWLDAYIAPIDDIDINNLRHFGAVVFILEHQDKVDELAKMDKAAIQRAIDRQLSEIGTEAHFKYILCIQEILYAVKKNYINEMSSLLQKQKSFLENLLNSSPDGP